MIPFDSSATSSFDIVIIGGGPGGLSAATWGVELGLSALIVESAPELGGQLLWIHNPIANHLGGSFTNGRSMRDALLDQVAERKFAVALGTEVISIDRSAQSLVLTEGRRVGFRYLIFATGLSRRTLGLGGESRLLGKGVLESGAGQREGVRGNTVAVVGGGDAAVENALILSEFASKVYLIHRRDCFRARDEMVSSLNERSNIEIMSDTRLESINGDERLVSITVSVANGAPREIPVENLLIRIGFAPNSSLVQGLVAMDENGYVIVDSEFATDDPLIHAVGDVACPVSPTISAAIGAGSVAAKSIHSKLRS